MKKLTCICALLFLCFSCGWAQMAETSRKNEFTVKFDSYIRQLMEKIPEIPGIAIVVIKDDQPIFLKAYGIADREAGLKADTNTLFYIASSTKSFTALSAALLDREGLIKLNDPITKYSKGISFKNPVPDKVTIRDLLTHTSGLQNDPLTFRMAYSGESGKKDMALVFANATTFTDSSYGKYSYDNLGYNIYAVLLQQSLDKKWQDLLQDKIFTPLKMNHTTAYISKAVVNKWTVAAPYVYTGNKGAVRSWLDKTDDNMQSAGGLFASIADVGTWLNVNMNNGKLHGRQVIPADIIQQCQTGYTKTVRDQAPFTGNGEYGLGWQIGVYKNEKVIYHHGGFPGYRSHISFLPGKKIAVAVLINDGSIGGRSSHLLATYAYEWWLQTENMEAIYAQQLEQTVAAYEKTKKEEQAAVANRAKRTWQLSLPLKDYTGKYKNPDYGTIEIFIQDSVLAAKMGRMRSQSTPYIEADAVRLELLPGTGSPIRFKKNAKGKIESIVYEDSEFVK